MSIHANYNNLYASPHKFVVIKTKLKNLEHFFLRHKNQNCSHFWSQANSKLSLPQHPIFYIILKYFKHLKRNHIINTHTYPSISIHANYNLIHKLIIIKNYASY